MKIFCVGRNYKEHAREMQQEAPSKPVIFMKPETALADISKAMPIPAFTKNLQHEIEIVLKINRSGKNIPMAEAGNFFSEWTVGIDFTARDLQSELKRKGLPWELSKSFDGAAVVGKFIPFLKKDLPALFRLEKNGNIVQSGNTDAMLFSFPKLISYISDYFTLEKGDLIFTGTPAGVAKVAPGDRLSGFLKGEKRFAIQMA